MTIRRGWDAAEQRVRSLAYAGLDLTALRVAVMRELAAAVPFEGAFFPTADPATLLYTSAVRVGMPDGLTGLFLDNEFNIADVNNFRALATGATTVATLDAATHGDRMASPRYRDLIEPIGLGDELRVVFRTSRTVWGFACLHRQAGASFDADETAFVQTLAPHVAEGLRRAVMIERAVTDATPQAPGILTLTPDMTLLAATPAGERWLDDLAATEQPRSRPLPVAVLAIAQALWDIPHTDRVPRLTVRGASGRWLVLHASYLLSPGDTQLAVVIEPASRSELEPMIAAGYSLTAREAEALTLLLRGLPTKSIASALRVTTNTANDHIKAVFTKIGVSSRGELMATVFRDQPQRNLK